MKLFARVVGITIGFILGLWTAVSYIRPESPVPTFTGRLSISVSLPDGAVLTPGQEFSVEVAYATPNGDEAGCDLVDPNYPFGVRISRIQFRYPASVLLAKKVPLGNVIESGMMTFQLPCGTSGVLNLVFQVNPNKPSWRDAGDQLVVFIPQIVQPGRGTTLALAPIEIEVFNFVSPWP